MQGFGEPILASANVALPGVVRPVGEPDLEVAGAGGVHDLDALDVVIDGALTDDRVEVRQAPELVDVVLERVGVDRPELNAQLGCVAAQPGVVVDLVPGDVEGDRRGQAGVRVDLRRVGDLLLNGAGGSGGAEDLKACSGIAERPGRKLNSLFGELGGDGGEGGHDDLPVVVETFQ